ncbi:MAG: hypothetical protein MO852_16785, partial [Candidatus Devosia euplotis]|nr:hypothetical protein [Candidatus Devosia euplotis]
CVGGTQTVCDTPPDACHEAVGTCQPSTGECVYAPIQDGSPCEDGNLCTEGESCMAGVCEGGSAIVCDDSNVCTTDGCIPATGCDFRPNSNPCDDRDLCTYADTCNNGMCVGTTVTCTNDECVVRECNGTASCNEMPLPGTEPCSADGNPCTDDFCDGFGLCAHRPKLNGASCGTASADRCCGGACVDISSNRSHCGGCNTACTGAFTCESVSVTNSCSSSPANTTGRCRCNADNSHCPRGQVCRTFTPFTNRCAPASGTNCAPGTTFTDLAACPNYCGF